MTYSRWGAGGAGGAVDKIVAGTNVTVSPVSGVGDVTVNANSPTLLPSQQSDLIERMTYANMLISASPFDGKIIYVTDNEIKENFVYDSNSSLWKSSSESFITLVNDSGVSMTIGQCVVYSHSNNESCRFAVTTFDTDGIGVVAIGGANGASILIKYSGIAVVDFITGFSHNAGTFIHASNSGVQGAALGATTATGSDFGRLLESRISTDNTAKILMTNVPR